MKIEPLARLLTGFLSYFTHNSNADKIESAFQNTLSRDGSTPNSMEATLDMGSNRIINLGAPRDLNDAVRLQDVTGDAVIEVSTDYNDLTNVPATFAPSAHTHAESEITGLVADLANKSDVSHTHTTGQVLGLDGAIDTRVVSHTLVAGSNITLTPQSGGTQMQITASSSGSTAWSSLTGVPTTFPPSAHTHPESDVTSLVADLAGKANTSHTHSEADITGLVADLAGKAASSHNHVSSHITDFTPAARAVLSAGTGISYNASTGVITNIGSSGSLPYQMYPAWENGITTGTVASTNVTNLNSLISTIHGLGGGTIQFFASGGYQIDGTINLKSNVGIIMSPGAYFSWVGSAGTDIFASSSSDVMVDSMFVINVNEGGSHTGNVFNLHSHMNCYFFLRGMGSSTSSTFFNNIADSTAGTPSFGAYNSNNNTAFNVYDIQHHGTCGTGVYIAGNNAGTQVVTDSTFVSLRISNATFRGIKIEKWADTITFSGLTYIGITGSGGAGLVVNEANSGTPSVYDIHFDHLAMDAFGSGLARYGVFLQVSKGITCDMYYPPDTENADFTGTNCTSYQFRKQITGTSRQASGSVDQIYIHQKNINTGL
jgi:hypothetical protein